MVEDSIVVFDVAAEVAIILVMICFILRGKRHSNGLHNHDYDKVMIDEDYIRND